MSTQVLSVSLPSSTLYVSGTVNDVAYVWTNTEGNAWQTTADRAADDLYRLALTVIDSAGLSTEISLTLYLGIANLITDRTQADVDRVRYLAQLGWAGMTEAEQAEWQTALKGAYNADDLNRVGAAMNYVADRLTEQGYAPSVSPKTDWSESAWLTPDAALVYLADLAELRRQFAMMQTTPEVPDDMERLTYQEANNIEKILEDIDTLLTNAALAWRYSGDLFSGEV